MSAADRRALVERPGVDLSVRRQCALLNLARSGVYRPKPVIEAGDLALMRRIDELHLELPFYGSRRMTFELYKEGRAVNRKRVQRLMRVMGIEALVPAPWHEQARARTEHISLPAVRTGDHRAEPCVGGRHNLIPMARGFRYLWRSLIGPVARFWLGVCRTRSIAASASRRWRRLWNSMESRAYSHRPRRAVHQRRVHRQAGKADVAISMDGRGRFMDNIFIERLWRSIKYEEVHLKAYADGRDARAAIGSWMTLLQF